MGFLIQILGAPKVPIWHLRNAVVICDLEFKVTFCDLRVGFT